FVFGLNGGLVSSLSVGQGLCRSILELLNEQRVGNGNLDDRIPQDNRFSRVSHVTSFINGSGRVARLSIADRGSAPRVTDSCLTACATTRHQGQVVHAYVSHFKICIDAVTGLNDV